VAAENAGIVCEIMEKFLHDGAYWATLAAGCLETRAHQWVMLARLGDPVFPDLLKQILLEAIIVPSSALLLASQVADTAADPANVMQRFSIETLQVGIQSLIRTTRDPVRSAEGVYRHSTAAPVSASVRDAVRRSVLAMGAGTALAAGAQYTQVDEDAGLAVFAAAVALLRDTLDPVA
jgi:hypothetical protein